jgi:2'-5' RNA ligase
MERPEMVIKKSGTARVFFALWPDSELQQCLHGLAEERWRQCEGRVMRADSLHMTLIFLGETERLRLPRLMLAADSVHTEAFTFELERIAYWRHNRIGYASPGAEVPALSRLVTELQDRLTTAGFRFDRREFKPHVTLLRNVVRIQEPSTFAPIQWKVEAFALVETVATERGLRYQVLNRWPLPAWVG